MAYSNGIHIEYEYDMDKCWPKIITMCLANSVITALEPNSLQNIFYISNNNSIP